MARLLIIDINVIFNEASIIQCLRLTQRLRSRFLPKLNPLLKDLLFEKTIELSQFADGRNLKIAFVCSSLNDVKTAGDNTRYFRLAENEWIDEITICNILTSHFLYLKGCFISLELPIMQGLSTFFKKHPIPLAQVMLFSSSESLAKEAMDEQLPVLQFRKTGELDQCHITHFFKKIAAILKIQPDKKIIISLDVDDSMLIEIAPDVFVINPYLKLFLADAINRFGFDKFHFIVVSSRLPDDLFEIHFPSHITTRKAIEMLQEALAPYIGGQKIIILSRHVHCLGVYSKSKNRVFASEYKIAVINRYFRDYRFPIFHIEDKDSENNFIVDCRADTTDIGLIKVYYGGECSPISFSVWLIPRVPVNLYDSFFRRRFLALSQQRSQQRTALTPRSGQ